MRLEKTTKAICENLEPVGAGALDSLVNNFTFGSVETIGKNKEVYGDDNRYYVGRLIADSAGIYLGVEGIVLGVGTEILGGALDLTGAGAPIGIQLNVAGIGIITGSATVVVNSGANFFQDTKDLFSNIEKAGDGKEQIVKPEAAATGSKKHGVKWKEGPARAMATGKAQGQWGKEDLDFATEKANTLGAGESAYFELPTGSTSKIHMPDGTTKPATKIWIRNNGTGTWHGYPMP
ncbi:hypothetical protein NU07_11540 [Listeria monocytogenes]|nr:hypothetical protein [Listeria monocytogenes]